MIWSKDRGYQGERAMAPTPPFSTGTSGLCVRISANGRWVYDRRHSGGGEALLKVDCERKPYWCPGAVGKDS